MALRAGDHVTITRAEDGMVVLDERAGRYWQLNASATAVLDCLLSGQSAAEIGERIARTRRVTPEKAAKDVDDFIGQMRSAGLVTD
ncbi:lasso peptide biosynthesis PqqD family chaperone [Saccharothrix xinjiangensis]|uniref:Lasso peptide biosynthesis PqqD family chaperone n=1 Tax=Saccharothrix xinjiangensis TaxID=204798 RepID=A0ABV9XZR0_9PSEU